MKDNIGETDDIRSEKPEILKMMEDDLKRWEAGLINPLWSECKYWNKVTFEIHQSLMENKKSKHYHYWNDK